MNIGIIGAGNVGGALGKRWTATGHKVKFGVRDANKPEVVALLGTCGANASASSVAEAASWAKGARVVKCFNTTGANRRHEARPRRRIGRDFAFKLLGR